MFDYVVNKGFCEVETVEMNVVFISIADKKHHFRRLVNGIVLR